MLYSIQYRKKYVEIESSDSVPRTFRGRCFDRFLTRKGSILSRNFDLFWNLKVHHIVHRISELDPILSQFSPVHPFTP
jgi:hypothetical protein